MDKNSSATTPDRSDEPEEPATIVDLSAQIDERDDIIRALNEALSLALTELDHAQAA